MYALGEALKILPWGTRGSIATPGPACQRYGGNTSCVEILGDEGTLLVLDAGTGVRPLGEALPNNIKRVDILLTHLHMDHIQGLGFFSALYDPEMAVHIWGPTCPTQSLSQRLTRYLSPPLFPVRLPDLPCQLTLHELPSDVFEIGEFRVNSSLVSHPGSTLGYRIESASSVVAYLPDHEPALGQGRVPSEPEWTSGFALAEGADLLIHDCQYTESEYPARVGWGHSTFGHSLDFAKLCGVEHLMAFHHDPSREDDALERHVRDAVQRFEPSFRVSIGAEGTPETLG